jgi:hypothetical protein
LEGRRAVEMLPVERDALNAVRVREFLAVIYAWTGEKGLACQELEAATKLPASASYGQLRLHPYWNPLRGDARFEKIVADFAPKYCTNYRKRSTGGVLSSSGAGVALGSASGLRVDVSFFFFFFEFFSRSVRTCMRRGKVLPVCAGISTSLYSPFDREAQPPPPKAIQTMAKMAIER